MNHTLSRTIAGNTLYLKKMTADLTEEDMLLSAGESNTIGWIIGHILNYRGEILRRMNIPCEKKETEKAFDRGVPKNKNIKINFAESMNDFAVRGGKIAEAIDSLGDEILKQPCGMELPGGNDIETLISFLSWHETFHLGQIDLIKAAAGKAGIK